MAVISITISESPLQIVAGIPKTIVLTTNIPATIFFTLDETEPTTSSSVITGPLTLPTDQGTVVLKAFATDGSSTSSIITQTYGSSSTSNRNSHDRITGAGPAKGATFPFGSTYVEPPALFGNLAGTVVDSPSIAGIPDGYDGTGTGTHSNETDASLDQYVFIFSETNAIGERGSGIGTLPATVLVRIPPPIQELSVASSGSNNINSATFNPRALVVFQDASEEPYDENVPKVNRPTFSLEDGTKTRYGALLQTRAEDGNIPMGTALRQQYNPKDHTITYYYRDQITNRWIISKVPFTPKNSDLENYSKIVFGRAQGSGQVFTWLPFRRRVLMQ